MSAFSSYPSFFNNSGDKYNGVPQNVLLRIFPYFLTAQPKSQIFTFPWIRINLPLLKQYSLVWDHDGWYDESACNRWLLIGSSQYMKLPTSLISSFVLENCRDDHLNLTPSSHIYFFDHERTHISILCWDDWERIGSSVILWIAIFLPRG